MDPRRPRPGTVRQERQRRTDRSSSTARLSGAWAQVDGGRVVTELIRPVSAAARRRDPAAADALTEWFDGVRVTPRFPTPLQTRLATGRLIVSNDRWYGRRPMSGDTWRD